MAAAMIGRDGRGRDGATGYLAWLAAKHPHLFTRLLAQLLPLQIMLEGKEQSLPGADDQGLTDKTKIVEEMRKRGLPVPQSLIDYTEAEKDDFLGRVVNFKKEHT